MCGSDAIASCTVNSVAIHLTLEPLEEGGYLATSPVWPDLLAQGRTIAETLDFAQDVAEKLIESYLEHGDPLPEPLSHRPVTFLIADR